MLSWNVRAPRGRPSRARSAGRNQGVRTAAVQTDATEGTVGNASARHIVADFNRDGMMDMGLVRVAGLDHNAHRLLER